MITTLLFQSWTLSEELSYNTSYLNYKTVESCLEYFNQGLWVLFGLVGVMGSTLHIIVLFHHDFSKPSYIYHKALVLNDLIFSAFGVLAMGIISIAIPNNVYGTYVTDLLLAYSNFACLTAESTILCMTLDRLIAIWLPLSFYNFNRNVVAIPLCIISLTLGSLYLPELGAENLTLNNTEYILIPTELGNSKVFMDFNLAVYYMELTVVYTLLLFSFIVVTGLCKQKLPTGNYINSSNLRLKRQLTILSLSCSLPAVANCTVYVVRSTVLSSYNLGPSAFSLSYERAMADLRRATLKAVLYEFEVATAILAHCLHFYIYMLLSINFRQKAKMILGRKNNYSNVSLQTLASRFPGHRTDRF